MSPLLPRLLTLAMEGVEGTFTSRRVDIGLDAGLSLILGGNGLGITQAPVKPPILDPYPLGRPSCGDACGIPTTNADITHG